jgi:hypothetical protein
MGVVKGFDRNFGHEEAPSLMTRGYKARALSEGTTDVVPALGVGDDVLVDTGPSTVA